MAGNVNNVLIGACWIVWGTAVIGFTIGGVEMRLATATKPIEADQTGTSRLNEFIIGRNVIIKMGLAETTVDDLYGILQNAGATQPNGEGTPVFVQANEGLTSIADVAPMLLRPVNAPDGSQDLYLPAVAYTGDIKFSYKCDQARAFDLQFVGYADVNFNLCYYGSTQMSQAMGAYLADNNHYNTPDHTVGDRLWEFVGDRQGNEIAYEPSAN